MSVTLTKYWRLKESTRVIAVPFEVTMTPNWIEISKEEFELAREEQNDTRS